MLPAPKSLISRGKSDVGQTLLYTVLYVGFTTQDVYNKVLGNGIRTERRLGG